LSVEVGGYLGDGILDKRWDEMKLDRCPSVVYSPLVRLENIEGWIIRLLAFASLLSFPALGLAFLRFEGGVGVGWGVDIEDEKGRGDL
jgi:hypothetical protein